MTKALRRAYGDDAARAAHYSAAAADAGGAAAAAATAAAGATFAPAARVGSHPRAAPPTDPVPALEVALLARRGPGSPLVAPSGWPAPHALLLPDVPHRILQQAVAILEEVPPRPPLRVSDAAALLRLGDFVQHPALCAAALDSIASRLTVGNALALFQLAQQQSCGPDAQDALATTCAAWLVDHADEAIAASPRGRRQRRACRELANAMAHGLCARVRARPLDLTHSESAVIYACAHAARPLLRPLRDPEMVAWLCARGDAATLSALIHALRVGDEQATVTWLGGAGGRGLRVAMAEGRPALACALLAAVPPGVACALLREDACAAFIAACSAGRLAVAQELWGEHADAATRAVLRRAQDGAGLRFAAAAGHHAVVTWWLTAWMSDGADEPLAGVAEALAAAAAAEHLAIMRELFAHVDPWDALGPALHAAAVRGARHAVTELLDELTQVAARDHIDLPRLDELPGALDAILEAVDAEDARMTKQLCLEFDDGYAPYVVRDAVATAMQWRRDAPADSGVADGGVAAGVWAEGSATDGGPTDDGAAHHDAAATEHDEGAAHPWLVSVFGAHAVAAACRAVAPERLLGAARHGHDALLAAGLQGRAAAALSVAWRRGRTPLSEAARVGRATTVALLLDPAHAVLRPSLDPGAALIEAAHAGHDAIAATLCAHVACDQRAYRLATAAAHAAGHAAVHARLARGARDDPGSRADFAEQVCAGLLWYGAPLAAVRHYLDADANIATLVDVLAGRSPARSPLPGEDILGEMLRREDLPVLAHVLTVAHAADASGGASSAGAMSGGGADVASRPAAGGAHSLAARLRAAVRARIGAACHGGPQALAWVLEQTPDAADRAALWGRLPWSEVPRMPAAVIAPLHAAAGANFDAEVGEATLTAAMASVQREPWRGPQLLATAVAILSALPIPERAALAQATGAALDALAYSCGDAPTRARLHELLGPECTAAAQQDVVALEWLLATDATARLQARVRATDAETLGAWAIARPGLMAELLALPDSRALAEEVVARVPAAAWASCTAMWTELERNLLRDYPAVTAALAPWLV